MKSFYCFLLILSLCCFQTLQYPFNYGKHYPHGVNSYKYLTGLDGTWKPLENVIYAFNYYPLKQYKFNQKDHPVISHAVFQMANGNTSVISLDKNNHLLLDYDHNGELDQFTNGSAFMQHNGRGASGKFVQNPFSLFLYETNVLGKIINQIYGGAIPGGLSQYNDHVKWEVLINKTNNWKPYNQKTFEYIALNGLYYLSKKNIKAAEKQYKLLSMNLIKQKNQNQYQNFKKNSQISLFAILSQFLFQITHKSNYLNNYMQLRKFLLNNIQYSQSNQTLSWLQYIKNTPKNLLTTQSMILGTLALSVGGNQIYEIGQTPLKYQKSFNFIYDKHQHMLSGIPDISKPGYMIQDLQIQLQNGYYQIQLILKSENNLKSEILAVFQIKNKNRFTKMNIHSDKLQKKGWTPIRYRLIGTKGLWNFKLFWTGKSRLDASLLRIQKVKTTTKNVLKQII